MKIAFTDKIVNIDFEDTVFDLHHIRYISRWKKWLLMFLPTHSHSDSGVTVKTKYWRGVAYIVSMKEEKKTADFEKGVSSTTVSDDFYGSGS